MNDYIIFEDFELLNSQKIYDKLNSIAQNLIQPFHKSLSLPLTRQNMITNHGNKSFLLPSKFKFPIVEPESGKINCELVTAAIIRSFINDYPETFKKAVQVAKENNCHIPSAMIKFQSSTPEKLFDDDDIDNTDDKEDDDIDNIDDKEDDDIDKNRDLLFDFTQIKKFLPDIDFKKINSDQENSKEFQNLKRILLVKYNADPDNLPIELLDNLSKIWDIDKEKDLSNNYTTIFLKTMHNFDCDNLAEATPDIKKKIFAQADKVWHLKNNIGYEKV